MSVTGLRLTLLLTVVASIAFTGCACGGRSVEIIDMQTERFAVPVESAQSAVIELELGIGELTITGGSTELCSGEFEYNVAEWKPVVDHGTEKGRAHVRITQHDLEGVSIEDDAHSAWTLQVSDGVPAVLDIDIGVGESRIDLTDALVERIDIDAGVGEVEIDAGSVGSDLTIDIDSGVGEVLIRVPDDIGVRVDCDSGIGSFDGLGLTRHSGGYVNAAYGDSDALISIRIDTGVGDVTVHSGTTTTSL